MLRVSHFTLFFLLSLLLFSSCAKGREELFSFPKTLTKSSVRPVGKVRLFYDKKEILDQAIIDRFLNDTTTQSFAHLPGQPIGSFFGSGNFPNPSKPDPQTRKDYLSYASATSDEIIFTFLTKDSLRLGQINYFVTHQGDKFTFTSAPLHESYLPESSSSLINKNLYETFYPDYINKKATVPHVAPSVTSKVHIINASGTYNVIQLPILCSFYKRQGYQQAIRGSIAAFDETYPSRMQQGDTLVVQEYMHELKTK